MLSVVCDGALSQGKRSWMLCEIGMGVWLPDASLDHGSCESVVVWRWPGTTKVAPYCRPLALRSWRSICSGIRARRRLHCETGRPRWTGPQMAIKRRVTQTPRSAPRTAFPRPPPARMSRPPSLGAGFQRDCLQRTTAARRALLAEGDDSGRGTCISRALPRHRSSSRI